MKKTTPYILSTMALFGLLAVSTKSNAQAWTMLGTPGFSVGTAYYSSIAIDTGGTPYVAYSDGGIGVKTVVMKYTGGTWTPVGTPGFSESYANYVAQAIDKHGTPYVVYEDGDPDVDTAKASVMKYNGSTWAYVGLRGFSDSQVQYTSIAIDTDGTPWVAFEQGYYGAARVMKYNGSSWVNVGGATMSDSAAESTFITIDRVNNTPYVVYVDIGDTSKITVKKYNGSGWVTVGSRGFTASGSHDPFIAIDGSGTPYVVYADGSDSSNTTVMKYNGSSWVTVGSRGFSAGHVALSTYYSTIAIDNTGTPWVAYLDWDMGTTGYATVRKYDGSNWVTVGGRGFSGSFVQFTSIAIDNSGTPYVAYMGGYGEKAIAQRLDTALDPITEDGPALLCAGTGTINLTEPRTGGIWSSSNTGIATVGSTGTVSGVSAGTAVISYTKGGYSVTFTVAVDSLPAAGAFAAGLDSLCPGSSIIINNTAVGGTWVSMDTTIAKFIPDIYITSTAYALLLGVAHGTASLAYIMSNPCGTDTTIYHYRISNCIDKVNDPGGNTFSLFPNPVSTELTIRSSGAPVKDIAIMNLLGQTVYHQPATANGQPVTINVAYLPVGVYVVRVNGMEMRKFVKKGG